MARNILTLVLGLALLGAGAARAADEPAGDMWKITIYLQRQPQALWLVKLQQKDGKWSAELKTTRDGVPATTIENVAVTDGLLTFTLKLDKGPTFVFEGKMPADAKKVLGTVQQGRGLVPAEVEKTTMTSLDEFEMAKDLVAKGGNGIEVADAATFLISRASAKKVKPAEVREWAAKAAKAAEAYGPRWEREITLRLVESLVKQDGFADTALEYARKVERGLGPKDKPIVQKKALDLLHEALVKSKKDDEAKAVEARIKKIDIGVQATPFAGRKTKSDRVVLVELFTGAQCPPCVAADVAFDALQKSYKPTEVVLLQYHLHIPGPDPLTNLDSIARSEFYGEAVEGTPAIFFNGRVGAPAGGGLEDGEEKYTDFREVIEPSLDKPSKAALKLQAALKDGKIEIAAEVSNLALAGEKVRLHLALVEEVVAYKGSNGQTNHHCVVRSLPGGAEGFALKDKTAKKSITVDVAGLKKSLTKYLDDFAAQAEKDMGPTLPKDRPLDLKKLRVVAFVQHDQTKEVYQAAQVEVKTE